MDNQSSTQARIISLFLMIFLLAFASSTRAEEHFALEFGNSAKGAQIGRLIYQRTIYDQTESNCQCDAAFLEFSISHWKSRNSAVGSDYLYEVGVQPVYRLQRGPISAGFQVRPFLEVSLGVHYLSKTVLANTSYYSSTKFQFGSHLAWGWTFGKNDAFVLAQRFQHLSNGNIRLPNPGINYQLIHMSYRY